MRMGIRSGLLALCVLFGTAALASTTGEKVDSAVAAASSAAARTGAAIERGAQAAASGVERGASWAATGIDKGAKAAQRGASAAAAKVGIGRADEPKQPAPVGTVTPRPLQKD